MNQKLLPKLDGIKIIRVAQPVLEGHLFALNEKNNLIVMNLNLLCHGKGFSPYEIMNFSKYAGGSLISIDQHNIWTIHASGEMQKFLIQPFAGTLRMEDSGEEDDFLVWRQKDHLLAAVDRFNVVSFWCTLTGKLIHKKVLEEHH